jgi:hypothetical protein
MKSYPVFYENRGTNVNIPIMLGKGKSLDATEALGQPFPIRWK